MSGTVYDNEEGTTKGKGKKHHNTMPKYTLAALPTKKQAMAGRGRLRLYRHASELVQQTGSVIGLLDHQAGRTWDSEEIPIHQDFHHDAAVALQ